jgi:hypothetical protein
VALSTDFMARANGLVELSNSFLIFYSITKNKSYLTEASSALESSLNYINAASYYNGLVIYTVLGESAETAKSARMKDQILDLEQKIGAMSDAILMESEK